MNWFFIFRLLNCWCYCVGFRFFNTVLDDWHTHTQNHLSALFQDYPCEPVPQKDKTNLDFIEARDSEWQWHYLGHLQVCTSLQTDDHASTQQLSFLQAVCPSCRPTNGVKALKANATWLTGENIRNNPFSVQWTCNLRLVECWLWWLGGSCNQEVVSNFRSQSMAV